MTQHISELLSSRRVLLLQGPMGEFFRLFADWLKGHQVDVLKINFNGGDRFFYPQQQNVFDYTGAVDEFAVWLKAFIEQQQIEAIVCFGDCRKYHLIAKQVTENTAVQFFAFEEGYIRPDYITFEKGGVNSFSSFSQQQYPETEKQACIPVHNQYRKMVRSAILYYLFGVLCRAHYPLYQHHRGLSTREELAYSLVSMWRRQINAIFEPRRFQQFIQQYDKQYYVFALQVHNDSQIRVHSELGSMEKYIEQVVESFSQFSAPHHHLIFKHHPMDRGYRHYGALLRKLAKRFDVTGRIHYFCDIHLPTLLKHSLGMVTVNSTTVIQALYHQIPVKVLGNALYNLPGLTNQNSLEQFWKQPGVVDHEYFLQFRHNLIAYSQLNGSFYGLSPWMQGEYDNPAAEDLTSSPP
ncbi:capsular biosynthesis protein [Acinetobacter rudis]|uniref:capsule biosynthesis protein n=1 Tax=Acinetobacter rudis TaxID=632955 RepID=UPI00280FEC52|nr:capsular biosynthesis protein [Acinetobacter rudis]MDQ8954040.1 capsular biosynthesis protein [Acinetobacter rudis]